MAARKRVSQKRIVARIHLRKADAKVVDDAAEAREMTRSGFMAKASVDEARRIMQGHGLAKAS